jgi:hypothetical protein
LGRCKTGFIVAGVGIGALRNADFLARFDDAVENFPAHPRQFHRQLAIGAVMLGVAQEMPVQLFKYRLDVVPAPTRQAELPPVIVIAGLAAHGKHGVD